MVDWDGMDADDLEGIIAENRASEQKHLQQLHMLL